MKTIYVASSWRNPWQPPVVAALREFGLDVYDFRNPRPGEDGFSWSQIDPYWEGWDPKQYREALEHPVAVAGFRSDMDALEACAACVLVLPCGNSAHLELGWAVGAGKKSAVLFPHGFRPTQIGGHTVSDEPCFICGDRKGCRLPGRLRQVEPELMPKMAGSLLINREELLVWAREL